MAEISGSSDFSPVQSSLQDVRPLPGVSSRPVPAVSQSAGTPEATLAPVHALSAPEAVPADAVDIKPPDQVSVAYRVDQKAQQVYVQFVDSKTGAVINQFPPTQVLAFEDQIADHLESYRQAQSAASSAGNAKDSTSVKEK